jgi:plasmid replication initiation protein
MTSLKIIVIVKNYFEGVVYLKEIIVHKPNQLIEILGVNISNLSLLTYNYILHKLQKEKTNSIKLTLAEISSNIDRNSHSYEDIYEVLKNLLEIKILSMDRKGKNWGGFSLISAFKKENDGIYIELPNLIVNELLKQEELYYTTIKLLEERTFKCVYSIIFYEIFKKYEKVELPKYTLETLRNLTKTQDKYKVYADFKKRVLSPALKEINNFNKDYEYYFEEMYTGRKVTDIQFLKKLRSKISDVEIVEIVEELTLSEKLLKAIKKAKKSIYIDKVYSDKAMKKLLSKYDESLIIRALEESSKYNQEIKSFSSLMTAKIEDIKNSSNEAIEKKLDKVVAPVPRKEITEENIADIFETDENIKELKRLLVKQAKEQGKLNDISSSLIKACRTREDIEMIANNLKIELNLELF